MVGTNASILPASCRASTRTFPLFSIAPFRLHGDIDILRASELNGPGVTCNRINRISNLPNNILISPLGKIRHTLDQFFHCIRNKAGSAAVTNLKDTTITLKNDDVKTPADKTRRYRFIHSPFSSFKVT